MGRKTRSNGRGEIRTAAASHIGASPRRTLLEDRSRAEVLNTAGGIRMALGVVADGIGGESAGERAAEITTSAVFDHCTKSMETHIPLMLEAALAEANTRVYLEGRANRRKLNMGSTAAVAAVVKNRLYVANAGDSRVYLIRGKDAIRLTLDHTWENEVVRSGKLKPEEAARHPRRKEIVRSIGYEPTVDVDLGIWLRGGDKDETEARAAQGMPLEAGDVILICSDGLIKARHDRSGSHYVEEDEIPRMVRGKDPEAAVEGLVKRALERNVDDNVSVVVLEIPGGRKPMGGWMRGVVALGAIGTLTALGFWLMPRVLGKAATGLPPTPTIPPLPSGVAFVSEMAGIAEVVVPGGGQHPMEVEEIIAAGEGVLIRTRGMGSYVRLGLADGSIVYIGPESEIRLMVIADGKSGEETVVGLERGTLLVAADQGQPMGFIVFSTGLGAARLLGSLMGVEHDPLAKRFDVDCFHDLCQVAAEGEGSQAFQLGSGQHAWLDASGALSEPDATRNERYAFGGYGGGLVPTPTAPIGADLWGSAQPTPTPIGPLFVPPTEPASQPTYPPPEKPKPGPNPTSTSPPPTSTSPPPTWTQPPPTATSLPPTETPEPTKTKNVPPPQRTLTPTPL